MINWQQLSTVDHIIQWDTKRAIETMKVVEPASFIAWLDIVFTIDWQEVYGYDIYQDIDRTPFIVMTQG